MFVSQRVCKSGNLQIWESANPGMAKSQTMQTDKQLQKSLLGCKSTHFFNKSNVFGGKKRNNAAII